MDFSSIISQIISYITSMFSSLGSGTISQSSLISTVNEYINGVIETYSSTGLIGNINDLKTQVADEIRDTFKNTPNESVANSIAENTEKDNSTVAYTYSRSDIPVVYNPSSLLVINGTDYTKYIQMPTWKINAKDIYEEKTNADKKFIRTVTRTRIMGTFTIIFNEIEAYTKFLSDCWNNKGSCGELQCTLYVNNKLQNVTAKVYLTMEPKNEVPYFGARAVSGFEITVEEQ